MNDKSRNSIIKDLTKAYELFENDGASLRELSDHTIQDVMMYKSLDAVSIAVLIHALYKGRLCINGNNKKKVLSLLKQTATSLQNRQFGVYNSKLESLFKMVNNCVTVDDSLKNVIYLAKIQKGASLFEQGVTAARAASIMGISVWDLSPYIQKRQIKFKPVNKNKFVQKIKVLDKLLNNNETIFIDTGTIITLITSRLISVLEEIKKKRDINFVITPYVYDELVTKPASIKKYQLESLEVRGLIENEIISVKNVSKQRVNQAEKRADKIIEIDGRTVDLVQKAEISCMVSGQPVLMDERTLRLICEDSEELLQVMTIRKRKAVTLNKNALEAFQAYVNCPLIFRSVELVTWATMNGMLTQYEFDDPKFALTSMLWACKSNGAAVSEQEIESLIDIASKHF